MTIGERIRQRRKELKLTADELAERLHKNRATIYRYENSEIERLPAEVLKPLSEILQVSPEYLMGWSTDDENKGLDRLVRDIEQDNNIKIEDVLASEKSIPVLTGVQNGNIQFEDCLRLSDLKGDLCWRADDDSMKQSGISAGTIIFADKTKDIQNGDIVIAYIDRKIILRKYYYYPESVKLVLSPDNTDSEPMLFIGNEINDIIIIGKVIAYYNSLK